MISRGPDDERRRLLAATDHLLDRIERLRLADRIQVPEQLRSQLTAVAAEVGVQPRLGVPTTLASAHDQVFRLQTSLLRSSGRAPRPEPASRRSASSTTVTRLVLPTRESAGSEAEWLEDVRLTVQRAQDRAHYLAAQAEAAVAWPLAGEAIANVRRRQADDAQRAYADLARDARRITGRPARLDPPLTLPASGRYEVGDIVVQQDVPDVLQRGLPVRLTRLERTILIVLAANGGRTVTREALQHVATDADPLLDIRSRVLSVHMAHLRAKLGRGYIETVPGVGYRLSSPPGAPAMDSSDAEQARRERRAERRDKVRRRVGATPEPPPLGGRTVRRPGR